MANTGPRKRGWIGVDFDRTIATYDTWQGTKLGAPIPAMVERVKRWLGEGREVRIFTARVSSRNEQASLKHDEGLWLSDSHRAAIELWCEQYIGQKLKVTAEKDFEMEWLYDDRAISVEPNTGRITTFAD